MSRPATADEQPHTSELEAFQLVGQDGHTETFAFPRHWACNSINLINTLQAIVHSDGDKNAIQRRASALVPTIVATARWEIGLGDHPLYRERGPWNDKTFNEGRSANKLKHVSAEKAHRSVFRRTAAPTATKAMSVITIESDEDDEDDRDDVVFVGITPKSEPSSHRGVKRKRGHGAFSASAAEAIEVYDSDLDPPTPTPLSRQTAPPTIQPTINEGAGEVPDPVAN